jgi:molecular chaperone GrpE (heat shock protein)
VKWPFFLGDALLLGVAWWIVIRNPEPFAAWSLTLLVACVAGGAWLGVLPFLTEHRAAMKLLESDSLHTVVDKINQLQKIGDRVADATSQWQDVQDRAAKTAGMAREMTDRMAVEAKAFAEFMEKANDAEKQHMSLEIEKMRRGEGDWLQVILVVMDNVFALHKAAVRSKKAAIVEQLTHFQHACREAIRRVGLIPFEIGPGKPYDPDTHQLATPNVQPSEGAQVEETLAPGYSFQGRPLRKPLVSINPPGASLSAPDAKAEPEDLFSMNAGASKLSPPASAPPPPADPSADDRLEMDEDSKPF